jgi:hypothetical protein
VVVDNENSLLQLESYGYVVQPFNDPHVFLSPPDVAFQGNAGP